MIRSIAATMLLFLVPVCAQAQIIIGNLPQSNDGTQSADITDLRQKAFRFTTPSLGIGAGELELRLRDFDVVGEAIAELRDFTGSTTAPGTNVLLSFNAPAPGGGGGLIQNYVFTPSSSFTLAPDTTYWLVVRGMAGGNADWMASSPAIPPSGMATYGSSSFTANGGTTWSNSTILSSFQFRAVPEPASLASLITIVVVGLGLRRK